MSAALTTTNGATLGHAVSTFSFTADQRKLILDTCCGGASQQEAQVLLGIAEMRGLNPITQECYFVKRWDKAKGGWTWAVQVSIDAMRIKAEESGLYAGQDEPEYEHNKDGAVVLARVRVYRKDWERPMVGVARWDEFVQLTKEGAPTKFWKDMPYNQLAKVAEAQALRKAFPARLAKLYTRDEMMQASNGEDRPEPARLATSKHDELTGEVIDTPSPEAVDDQAQKVGAQLAKAIAGAVDLDALKKVWASAMAAQKGGFITLTQRATLLDAKDARKAELLRPKSVSEIHAGNEMPEGWGGEPPMGALEGERQPGEEG